VTETGLDLHALDEQLAPAVRGRRVIVVTPGAAGAMESVNQLRRYGAQRPLVIAHGPGLGVPPTAAEAELLIHPLPELPTLMSAEIQAHISFVADLPPAVVAAVERYDPDASAVWWLQPMVTSARTLLGRQAIGGRRQTWAALEDKTLGDQLFDTAGVRRPATLVVHARSSALLAAAEELNAGAGAGTVWSGDAREGMNGGGDFVRWVRTDAAASRAIQLFEAHCDRVRVSPFLDGVPCSIHGVVLPDGVAVLRPVELLVLRSQEDRFVYAGMSTWWDPPVRDRQVMREAAGSVGAHLASTFGFRGGFSVDGVLSAQGWLPTELNPRFAGGLTTIARALDGFPLQFLQASLAAGIDTGLTACGLEQSLLAAADERRNMVMHAISTAFRSEQTVTADVVFDGRSFRRAEPGSTPIGKVEVGPAALGVIARFSPAPSTMAPGDRGAPYACALLDFADREYGTDFGSCSPAPAASHSDVSGASAADDPG